MLADGNLIIAQVWTPHESNGVAVTFFAEHKKVDTCAITELNLVRFLMQKATTEKRRKGRRLKNRRDVVRQSF